MGINHTVMNPGWVTAHQRTHKGPSVHERDPLMWGIALFRFINCVIGNEDKFKCIDWACQSWKHNDLQSLWVYQFAFKFKDPLVPKISSGWLQSTNVRFHNLHVREGLPVTSCFSVIQLTALTAFQSKLTTVRLTAYLYSGPIKM